MQQVHCLSEELPAQAEVQGQIRLDLVVVLEVEGGVRLSEFGGEAVAVAKGEGVGGAAHEVAEAGKGESPVVVGQEGVGRVLVGPFSTKQDGLLALAPGDVILHLGYLHRAALGDVGGIAESQHGHRLAAGGVGDLAANAYGGTALVGCCPHALGVGAALEQDRGLLEGVANLVHERGGEGVAPVTTDRMGDVWHVIPTTRDYAAAGIDKGVVLVEVADEEMVLGCGRPIHALQELLVVRKRGHAATDLRHLDVRFRRPNRDRQADGIAYGFRVTGFDGVGAVVDERRYAGITGEGGRELG